MRRPTKFYVSQRAAANRQRLLTVQEREAQERERELRLIRSTQDTNPQTKTTESKIE